MDGRLSVFVRPDAADQRDDLRFFIDLGGLVTLMNGICPLQDALVDGAEPCEMADPNVIFLGKLQQSGHDFVALSHIDAIGSAGTAQIGHFQSGCVPGFNNVAGFRRRRWLLPAESICVGECHAAGQQD
jgi:hypothetical protein